MINLHPNYSIDQTTLPNCDSVLTKEQAQEKFWNLGDKFWMQIIDGKFHKHGPLVFDEALHMGDKEPGFFNSLKNGCEFASQHLNEKLSIHFYKELHKVLCAHFKGKENNTEMDASLAGNFRNTGTRARYDLQSHNEKARENYLILILHRMCFEENAPDESYYGTSHNTTFSLLECEIKKFGRHHGCPTEWVEKKIQYWKNQTGISEILQKEYEKSTKWVVGYKENWNLKIDELNNYLSETCKNMGVKNIATFRIISDALSNILHLDYAKLTPEEHQQIVQMLFDEYNNKIDEINSNSQKFHVTGNSQINAKIEAVAHLFQMLEWLHPFQDGQGRIDLVVQAKLLCEVGANPAILNEPYVSSLSLLSEWLESLLFGIEEWKSKV